MSVSVSASAVVVENKMDDVRDRRSKEPLLSSKLGGGVAVHAFEEKGCTDWERIDMQTRTEERVAKGDCVG